jgi:hypothetical protein
MREEEAFTQAQTEKLQQKNMALARIISQQEQLIADARRWLAEFESRHLSIQQSFAQLTSKVSS